MVTTIIYPILCSLLTIPVGLISVRQLPIPMERTILTQSTLQKMSLPPVTTTYHRIRLLMETEDDSADPEPDYRFTSNTH